METCHICDESLTPFIDKIRDYEYGVPWSSQLWICPQCGLVTHMPEVKSSEIPGLYPRNYLAHSTASAGRGVYGTLKMWIANRSLEKITRHIPPGGSFLEVGCGNGHFVRRVADARPDANLLGVDIEPFRGPTIPRFSFHHGQLEDLDLDSVHADVIYFSNLIEHVASPARFLEACMKLLKPGGLIVGVTPDHLSLDRRIFGQYWAGYHYPRHTFVFNHRNIKALLSKLGYQETVIRGDYSFWYLSLANVLIELPGTKRRGLLFAAISAAFLPLDRLLNLFTVHGSMTFTARRPR